MDVQRNAPDRAGMLEQVRGYWVALCSDGQPPLRSAIDPRGIAGALEYCLVAERAATGTMVIRIGGMGLAEIAGIDLSGMPFLSLFDTAARDAVARTVDRALDGPAAVELWLEALRGPGRPPLEARLLLLPLRAADGQVRMLLGCLHTAGEVGQPPRRFAVARRAALPAVAAAVEPAFAEPVVAFVGPAPHLRVVRRAL